MDRGSSKKLKANSQKLEARGQKPFPTTKD
jgi:hypothetical protein